MVVGGRSATVLSGTGRRRARFDLHSLRATGERPERRSDPVRNELEPTTAGPGEPSPNEAMWRGLLLGTDPRYARARGWLKHVPSEPRCKMCAAPFEGLGKPLMRLLHRDRWVKNPLYCSLCFNVLDAYHGGAEIEASFLFADVRGSTALAEGISPTEFRRQLNRFYAAASRVLVEHDAIVDKFVGDEVIGIFIPALAREAHAAQAVEAARELLRATGHADPAGPWLPIGIGVHTGVAFVGSVGVPPVTDLTALGDVVNTTARLASAAATGEILVTQAAAEASHIETTSLERRHLELKGKSEATPVFVARVN
jgi:adenylate cyclase